VSTSKVASMRDAVADLVRDGDTVAIEGFTHLIGFAAGHEIIRQGRRDLTLARLTPDLIYDQMIAAGVARKLIFSWLGNPGVGGLGAIRRRTEASTSAPDGRDGLLPRLELEEYSHFGMVGRYTAGAANLPFYPIRSYFETDLPKANPLIREVASPYGDGVVYAVPPLKPDVTIVHAQRADAAGNTQVWGLLGCQKEAAFAADRVIVVVEEVVDEAVVRADPNRTIIPGLIVDAVVVEPFGAHPSYVQGAYDRDNRFYLEWDAITKDEDALQRWLRAWVFDLESRAAYVDKLGVERVTALRPGTAPSGSVDYGRYE
jgi:glutaconate CoA-transferase subunit A